MIRKVLPLSETDLIEELNIIEAIGHNGSYNQKLIN